MERRYLVLISVSGSDDHEVKSGVKHIYSDISGSAEAIISFVGLDLGIALPCHRLIGPYLPWRKHCGTGTGSPGIYVGRSRTQLWFCLSSSCARRCCECNQALIYFSDASS
jgi:hypothetical protein